MTQNSPTPPKTTPDGTTSRECHLARLGYVVQHLEDAARASELHLKRLRYLRLGEKHIRRSEEAARLRREGAASVRWAIEELRR